MMQHLEGLNEAQTKAALLIEGPLLIVAGAGAGKTTTIVRRILGLIERGIPGERILAVTFTNKAAAEMRERIEARLPALATLPVVKTFHALGLMILREHAALLSLPKRFSVLDEGDALAVLKEAIVGEGLDPKQFEPRRLKGTISKEKGRGHDVLDYEATAEGYFPELVARIWRRYEATLAERRALDFDDLIMRTVRLMKEHPEVRAKLERRFEYLHIDEYQDTNASQYELARLIAGERHNICAVGDSDQNIYGWRGASLRNILSFERDYQNATVVLLEENYRSTKTIVAASNEVIKRNKIRVEKTLWTENAIGEPISYVEAAGEEDEAAFVARRAKTLIAQGVLPDDMAVLYRANFQSRVLEEAFLREGVPYQVLGVRFFERREVKDVLSYLRAAENEKNLADWKRAVEAPPRGIGPATIAKVFAGQTAALSLAARTKVLAFEELLAELRERMATTPVSRTLRFVIERSGLEEYLKESGEEGAERLANVAELVSLALRYDALPPEEGMDRFLTDAALRSDQDELGEREHGGVKLMTVHAGKGLEFDTVFVTGLEQDLFPYARGAEASPEEREEERRLFYVAMTRAKRKLYLVAAATRTVFGALQANTPSEFLADIPPALLTIESAYGAGERTVHI